MKKKTMLILGIIVFVLLAAAVFAPEGEQGSVQTVDAGEKIIYSDLTIYPENITSFTDLATVVYNQDGQGKLKIKWNGTETLDNEIDLETAIFFGGEQFEPKDFPEMNYIINIEEADDFYKFNLSFNLPANDTVISLDINTDFVYSLHDDYVNVDVHKIGFQDAIFEGYNVSIGIDINPALKEVIRINITRDWVADGFSVGDAIVIDPTIETVDSTDDVGEDCSIAIDSQNVTHISYYADSGDDLKYCNNTGGSWSCAIILNGGIYPRGEYTSLAVDSTDTIHISSHDAFDDRLYYCNNTGGSWNCGIIDAVNANGQYSSIAIDSNDVVHISHYSATTDQLRYCNVTGGVAACSVADTTVNSGLYSSIAIDSNDVVHISHYDLTADDLRYCNNTGGSWSCVAVETAGNTGQYSSIAIDSNDVVHISHYDGDLRYCNNTGGSWSCVAVESTNYPGQWSSIAVDENDFVHITHFDSIADDLRYCNTSDFSTWNCEIIADFTSSAGTYTYGRSLAIQTGRLSTSTTFSNETHMCYFDDDTDDLMYATTTQDPNVAPTLGLEVEPTDPSTYSNGATYQFNITACDDVAYSNISEIIFEWNGANTTITTNVTVNASCNEYHTTKSGLDAGTYDWKWYANDSKGEWTNVVSDTWTLNKANPSFSSSVTASITYGAASDYSASESNAGDTGCTYALYRNGSSIDTGSSVSDTTTLAASSYNYTYSTAGCTNYNADSDYKALVVNKATPALSTSVTSSINYGTASDYSGSESNTGDNDCTYTLYRNGSSIDTGSSVSDTSVLSGR
ncbi:MAG: hypothetical protein KAJ24_02185, partial [Candidatus Aenigmarchaeota archaeon]|nr:hypothetical protein [Candidatus Aenigmarchaeota archaeon]